MNVIFIQNYLEKFYGFMLFSSLLKSHGHNCDIIVDCFEKDLFKRIKLLKPDLIAFNLISENYLWVSSVSKKIKADMDIPIVVGGALPTLCPEIIEENCFDIACIGEGEIAMLALADNLSQGRAITQINNLWVKQGSQIYKNPVGKLIEDLDSLPLPDRSLYLKYDFYKELSSDVFFISRGCKCGCVFCYSNKLNELYIGKGEIVRRYSVERAIAEIKDALNKKKISNLVFFDDNFTLCTEEWVESFCTKYKKEINLPFGIMTRYDLISENKVRLLKLAGCRYIRIAIETADAHARNVILNKNLSLEQIIKGNEIMRKYGIKIVLYTIVNLPHETIKQALDTYELTKKLKPSFVFTCLLDVYPKTKFKEYLVKEGVIENANLEESPSYLPYYLDSPYKREMLNLKSLFCFGVYLRIPREILGILARALPCGLTSKISETVKFIVFMKNIVGLSWRDVLKMVYVRSMAQLNLIK